METIPLWKMLFFGVHSMFFFCIHLWSTRITFPEMCAFPMFTSKAIENIALIMGETIFLELCSELCNSLSLILGLEYAIRYNRYSIRFCNLLLSINYLHLLKSFHFNQALFFLYAVIQAQANISLTNSKLLFD